MATCRHCAKRRAAHTWTTRPCAIGRSLKIPLCSPCDAKLNSYVVRFIRRADAVAIITRYRKKIGLT